MATTDSLVDEILQYEKQTADDGGDQAPAHTK